MTNQKVIEGGDVDFGDAQAQPDVATQPPVQPAQPSLVTGDYSWVPAAMDGLADAYTPTEYIYNGSWTTIELNDTEKQLIPYLICINNSWVASSSTSPVGVIRAGLEHLIGPEIADSGIYEVTGLEGDEDVDTNILINLLPELQHIRTLLGKQINKGSENVETLYSTPLEARAFFAGALGKDLDIQITTKDAIAYAKKINQVPRVAEYIKQLRGII